MTSPLPASSPPGTWRVLAPALLGWAVAAGAVTLPGAARWIAGVAVVGGSIALAVAARCRVRARVREGALAVHDRMPALRDGLPALMGAMLLACALLVLLGARITVEEVRRADPQLVAAAQTGAQLEFAARLTGFAEVERSEFGVRGWVRAAAQQPTGSVPVLLWLSEAPGDEWAPGMRVMVRGSPERFDPASSVAYGVRVHELMVADAQPVEARLGAVAAALRLGLREAAARVPGAELVPGFAVGDTALVGARLEEQMLGSSLTHLTAVSGANCALVTGVVLWVLSRLGAGRRSRLLAAGAVLILFLGVVGPDASVQRAAVMAAVVLASGFGGKRSVALPALGLAMIVLLIADPWQALQPGFALSIAATAGILLLASPLGRWLARRARLPRVLALPIAVACAAQFACGPLLLLLQPGIPAVGVLANVAAAPAAPLGTGLGLVAALVLPISPALGHALVVLASLPARWVAATAGLAAALPLARWHWPEGWPGALLLAACQTALLLAWALRRGHLSWRRGVRVAPRRPWAQAVPPPRSLRRASTALVCGALGVIVAVTVVTPVAVRVSGPNGWAVVACDVGQGDALLLRDPRDPEIVMLVDTGDDPQLLTACLDRFGVGRIALLVLSHDDRDHVGALDAVLDRIDAALIAPTPSRSETGAREIVQQLAGADVPVRVGAAGESGALAQGLDWQVLAPRAGVAPADTNASSLVLLVNAGGTRTLLLGDTGFEQQSALVRDAVDASALEAHVLKVAHHGSRDQDPALPMNVGAEWALVSVGADNGYGHPAGETLAQLSLVGTRVLRTDQHGSIALVPGDAGGLSAWVAGRRA